MGLDDVDKRIVAAIEDGLPLTERPYEDVGRAVGLAEAAVLDRLTRMLQAGVLKRLGVIVRHRPLGYRANAMCVWDVPDDLVEATGARLAKVDFVTLCYARPRRLPAWPYNLFCMIHGAERAVVEAQVASLDELCGMNMFPRAVLFSRRCFKQRGARYAGRDDVRATRVA